MKNSLPLPGAERRPTACPMGERPPGTLVLTAQAVDFDGSGTAVDPPSPPPIAAPAASRLVLAPAAQWLPKPEPLIQCEATAVLDTGFFKKGLSVARHSRVEVAMDSMDGLVAVLGANRYSEAKGDRFDGVYDLADRRWVRLRPAGAGGQRFEIQTAVATADAPGPRSWTLRGWRAREAEPVTIATLACR